MTPPMDTLASERCQRLEPYYGEQRLLPRIADDVTLNLIAPKLSWGVCRRLVSVSRGWRHVIRSGAVHHARVHSQSTETLVLLSYKPSQFCRAVTLYSMRENRCYNLPPCPYLDGTIPPTSKCVSLDGKIYVLGGEFLTPWKIPCSNGVYVLDVARGSQWKPCAQMIEPRLDFGYGVFNGKIYVFGGLGSRTAVCGSEVYDPQEDTWSPLKAMASLRFNHHVATVGAELTVHGGQAVGRTEEAWARWTRYHSRQDFAKSKFMVLADCLYDCTADAEDSIWTVHYHAKKANSLEIYNVDNDEWTVVEPMPRHKSDVSFMANGKLHVISKKDIYVHDTEANSWIHLHSHSFSARGLVNSQRIIGRTALAVGDRLLTIVEGTDRCGKTIVYKACLVHGTGLGSSSKNIKWERAPFNIYFEEKNIEFTNYSMHPIEL